MAQDIDRLLRKVAPLRPRQVEQWRRARELADPETRTLLDRHILLTARNLLGDIDSKPLLSLPPEKRIKGSIHLGAVVYDRERWPIGLSRAELLQHMAILGRSGAGKTTVVFHLLEQLSDKGIPWLFLDWKRTARHMLPRLKGRVHVYTPGRSLSPLPFNPFLPPPGRETSPYLNHVVDVLGDAYTLGDAARSLLHKALQTCLGSGDQITVDRVLDSLRKIPETERVRGWKASAIRAVESLQSAALTSVDTDDQKMFIQSCLDRQTIIELDALAPSGKKFLVPMLAHWLSSALMERPEREELRIVLIVEEAHHVLYNSPSRGKETMMEVLLRQCRELGLGVIVVDQHPHLLSSAALQNVHCSICLNQKDPRDMRVAAALSRLEGEDAGCLGRLPVGYGVVSLQDRWREPILVRFPEVGIEKGSISDGVLRQYLADSASKEVLRGRFGGIPRVRVSDDGLNEAEVEFIRDVLTHPDDGVRARYLRLRLSGGRGNRIKRRLVKAGLLREEIVAVGTSRKVLLGLTPGAQRMFGDAEASATRESLTHAYWKHRLAQQLEEHGFDVEVESPRINGRVDIRAARNGRTFGIEIETGKSDVSANVRAGLRSRFERIIVVATDAGALEKVERDLGRAGLLVPGRVEVVLRDQGGWVNALTSSTDSAPASAA